MVFIADIALKQKIEREMKERFPEKAKKCLRCGKLLGKRSNSYMCSFHYKQFKQEEKRLKKWITKIKNTPELKK